MVCDQFGGAWVGTMIGGRGVLVGKGLVEFEVTGGNKVEEGLRVVVVVRRVVVVVRLVVVVVRLVVALK